MPTKDADVAARLAPDVRAHIMLTVRTPLRRGSASDRTYSASVPLTAAKLRSVLRLVPAGAWRKNAPSRRVESSEIEQAVTEALAKNKR